MRIEVEVVGGTNVGGYTNTTCCTAVNFGSLGLYYHHHHRRVDINILTKLYESRLLTCSPIDRCETLATITSAPSYVSV